MKFDSEPVYNEKYLKIKSYNGKIDTNFHYNKIPKESSKFICLSVILIDSVFRTGKIIILKCFQRNVNMLLKKKRCQSILLMIQKFLLMILIEKTLMKKILMKKTRMKKIKYRMCVFFEQF